MDPGKTSTSYLFVSNDHQPSNYRAAPAEKNQKSDAGPAVHTTRNPQMSPAHSNRLLDTTTVAAQDLESSHIIRSVRK